MGAVPGHQFSGIIAAVGEGAGELRTGAAVFGMNDWFSDDAMTLLEAGKLRPVVDAVVPFSRAPEVYEGNVARS
jgi:NADPH:quinone reductase-like Zn-dependent oxidoreductase